MCFSKGVYVKEFLTYIHTEMYELKDVNDNLGNESLLKGFLIYTLNYTISWMLWYVKKIF